MKKPTWKEGVGWRYEKEPRQTRRMKGHDYSVPGTYEVTIVVEGRKPVFGTIAGTSAPNGEPPHLEASPLGHAVLHDEIP